MSVLLIFGVFLLPSSFIVLLCRQIDRILFGLLGGGELQMAGWVDSLLSLFFSRAVPQVFGVGERDQPQNEPRSVTQECQVCIVLEGFLSSRELSRKIQ